MQWDIIIFSETKSSHDIVELDDGVQSHVCFGIGRKTIAAGVAILMHVWHKKWAKRNVVLSEGAWYVDVQIGKEKLRIIAAFAPHAGYFFFLNRRSLRFSDCFTGQSPGIGRNEVAISIPVAPALRGSWPSPSQSSLRRGWEAAGLWGWVWGLGQELAPERIITFNIGKMGAVLVEEARGKGLQGSMGQLGRPSVDDGNCHRVLEEAGWGFRVCEELDKTGGFFAPSSSCFYAKDDEATSSAAHEFGVCALLSASGFGQGGSRILPGSAPWLAISGEGRNYGGVNC